MSIWSTCIKIVYGNVHLKYMIYEKSIWSCSKGFLYLLRVTNKHLQRHHHVYHVPSESRAGALSRHAEHEHFLRAISFSLYLSATSQTYWCNIVVRAYKVSVFCCSLFKSADCFHAASETCLAPLCHMYMCVYGIIVTVKLAFMFIIFDASNFKYLPWHMLMFHRVISQLMSRYIPYHKRASARLV